MKTIRLMLLLLHALVLTGFAQTKKEIAAVELDASEINSELKLYADLKNPFRLTIHGLTKSPDLAVCYSPSTGKYGPTKTFKAGDAYAVDFAIQDRQLKVTGADNKPMGIPASDRVLLRCNGNEFSILQAGSGSSDNDQTKGNPTTVKPGLINGIALHDAVKAYDFVKRSDKGLYKFLTGLKGGTLGGLADAKKAYAGNEFILSLLNDLKLENDKAGSQSATSSGGLLGKVLNTDVTNLADGIAKFLVDRSKKELSINFFNHFKALLNDEKYKDARILFPKTLEGLNAIDKQIYQYENYITMLRESFQQDLAGLVEHMPKVVREGRYKDYFEKNPKLKYSILSGLFVASGLLEGTHPGEIIATLPINTIDSIREAGVTGGFQTLQLISESLKSREPGRYWARADTLKMLMQNGDREFYAARFYLGFLYEKADGISFGATDDASLRVLLNKLAETADKTDFIKKVKATVVYLQEAGQRCNSIEAAIAAIKAKKPEAASMEAYLKVFNSSSDLLEHLMNYGSLPFINQPMDGDVKKYFNYSRKASEIAFNISQKNYGSAVVSAYSTYLLYLDKRDAKSEVISNSALAAKSATTEQINEENNNAESTANFIRKYGNFMANVVKAENSDEIAAAIESVALPTGSASIKRKSNVNISLNAYVGPYYGIEKIKNLDSGDKPNSFGLTAPIGIAFSKGIGWRKKSSWSTSLFVSVIDLGAPVAFRFKDADTEQIPSIKLKDIISPGVFFSLGIPRVPLSVNAGYQTGPLLRKLSDSAAKVAGSTYGRYSVSVVLDIPLLNFFTSRDEERMTRN